jgi:crotonobetainyl-CoA:carnitine CoA-transferase CaiB-like acyl-CoA transferase
VNTIAQALEDPQIRARGMLQDVHGGRFLRTPLYFSRTPGGIRRGPAEVGEHTREVLRERGIGEDAIERLISEGVIAERSTREPEA